MTNYLYYFSGLDDFFVVASCEDSAWLTVAAAQEMSVRKFARLQFPFMRRVEENEMIKVYGRSCTVGDYLRQCPPSIVDASITF